MELFEIMVERLVKGVELFAIAAGIKVTQWL